MFRRGEAEMDQIMNGIFASLPLEQRLLALTIEERLAGLSPEQRLQGLTPEELQRLRELLDQTAPTCYVSGPESK